MKVYELNELTNKSCDDLKRWFLNLEISDIFIGAFVLIVLFTIYCIWVNAEQDDEYY